MSPVFKFGGRSRRLVMGSVAIALSAACGPSGRVHTGQGEHGPPPDAAPSEVSRSVSTSTQAAYSILDDLRSRLTDAFAEADEDAIVALFTNDARLTLPRRPSADGRAQIRDHLSILLHEGNVRLSLEPTPGASRILEGQNVEERGRFTLEIRTTQGDLRSWTGPYELEGRLADGLKLTRLTLDAEP